MHIQFDSKNRNEVLAAKAALDFLAEAIQQPREPKPEERKPEVKNDAVAVPAIALAANIDPSISEEVVLPNPLPEQIPNPLQTEEKKTKPFIPRNRESVLFENRLSEKERKAYPGLYKLAVITLEWMEPNKLYAVGEIYDFMKHIGHPASSGSGVLTHLVQMGYVERPMRALYKRVK